MDREIGIGGTLGIRAAESLRSLRTHLVQHNRTTKSQCGKVVDSRRKCSLASNCRDLDAAWIALGYKFRWSVELFFRWFKCILGCQHLLSTCQNGVAIQVYLALIASLVISLWTGHKPTKRTFEMICHSFGGWATEAELLAHIRKLDEQPKAKSKKS